MGEQRRTHAATTTAGLDLPRSPRKAKPKANLPAVEPFVPGHPSVKIRQVDIVCHEIAHGHGLIKACEIAGVCDDSFMRAVNDHAETCGKYARAREQQGHWYADAIQDVPLTVLDMQTARLICDNLKWAAARRAPRHYGDKIDVTSDGKALGESLAEAGMAAIAAAKARKAGGAP